MRWLEKLEEFLIIVLMAAMAVLTFGQVVARYVFNYSFVWAMEVTGVMFAWLIFIGMAYGVRVGSHIGVDAAVRLLGPRAMRVVGVIAALLCIGYAVIVTWGGYQYVTRMKDVGILMQDVPVAQWIPRLIMPIGFGLLTFRFAQVLWRILSGQQAHLLADEAADALKLRQDEPTQEVRP